MHKRLLIFIAACFYYSGLVKLARWWRRHTGQHLIILNYHCASGGNLESHLLYLRRHYRILPLETALEELYMPDKRKDSGGASGDHRTPLALTFDDGYHDNYTHGFALARKLQIPFTIFLVPGYIESGDHFWWREGNRLTTHTSVREVTIEGHTYHLQRARERKMLAEVIMARLCQTGSVAERDALLTSFRQALPVPVTTASKEEDARPLTWDEVHEMEQSGWVSYGAHTMYHPILAYLDNASELQNEVEKCRAVLEQQLGHPVRTFAYPIGQSQHIGDNTVDAVRQAGYDWALTATNGVNTPHSDPYRLRRIEADVSQHWLVVAAEAAGLWGFFTWLRWILLMRKGIYRP